MIVQRVEKHVIKSSNSYYPMFVDFAFKSKNLYNHANYIVRNEFINNGRWIGRNELDKILKADKEYDDYRKMPSAQTAQQTLRLLERNWKSYFSSIKDWSKHKDRYNGKPKLPKYKQKFSKYVFILTNQEAKLKNNIIKFSKVFNDFTLHPKFINLQNFVSFQQARFIPNHNSFTVELVYNIDIPDAPLINNGRYLSIDIGLDNLATVVNNAGLNPFIINGKGLKSINKYYNKQISYYMSIAQRMNHSNYTRRMYSITEKRNRKIDDYMHKASRYLISYALSNHFNTLIIGRNKGWKDKSVMSKRVNQSFIGIPHLRFIEMVQYKAQTVGIKVILTEENYTSGTSFLDSEPPTKEYYDKSRRVHRGLFISNNGTKINADVNGAYQIMKKVFPNAFADGIQGVALHPIRVNAA